MARTEALELKYDAVLVFEEDLCCMKLGALIVYIVSATNSTGGPVYFPGI